MLIPSFIRILQQEQPRIHEALDRAVKRLPAPVREVAGYVLLAGGKRLRPLLTLTSARMYGCDEATLYDLATAPELIHVASLLHDDVLDEAESRRGKRSAHLVYGVTPTLLAGDAMLAEASRLVAACGKPAMVECLSEAMIRTVAGEAREIELQRFLAHGMEEYLDMVEGKTGWLIRASCRLGALYAGAPESGVEALSRFGLHLGVAFQMVDDALDFADAADTGKPTGGDLREGKLTPPLMAYREWLTGAEREDFERKFRSGDWNGAEVEAVSRRIRAEGFDTRARELANEHLKRAEAALEDLPAGPGRELFRKALGFVRDRRG